MILVECLVCGRVDRRPYVEVPVHSECGEGMPLRIERFMHGAVRATCRKHDGDYLKVEVV